MEITSERVNSLLSRTRDLVRPSLADTPQFTADADLQDSPKSDEELPELSYVNDTPESFEPQQPSKELKLDKRKASFSPKPRPIEKQANKSIDKSMIDDLESAIEELQKSRTFEKVRSSLKKDRNLLERISLKLQSKKPKDSHEEKYKNKLAKLYTVVQQEAKMMDDRYSQLLEENEVLKQIISQTSRNQSSSSALYIVTKLAKSAPEQASNLSLPETELTNYTEDLDSLARQYVASLSSTEDLSSVASVLANQLLSVQSSRLSSEEKATLSIAEEERRVSELEQEVKDLERKLMLSS